MRIFQKLNVYQKNTSNHVKQYTYIVKTTREIKEQNEFFRKKTTYALLRDAWFEINCICEI